MFSATHCYVRGVFFCRHLVNHVIFFVKKKVTTPVTLIAAGPLGIMIAILPDEVLQDQIALKQNRILQLDWIAILVPCVCWLWRATGAAV